MYSGIVVQIKMVSLGYGGTVITLRSPLPMGNDPLYQTEHQKRMVAKKLAFPKASN